MIRFTMMLITAVLSFPQAKSQTVVYGQVCGAKSSTITWNKVESDGKIYITTTQGAEVQEYVMNDGYATLSWKYVDSAANTSLTTVMKSGVYHISGTLEGKPCTKTRKSNGYPWYQNIGFNIGRTMIGRESCKFECIRPDNLKLYEMQADKKDFETIDGIRARRISVHLTGALSRFFGSDYYVDATTTEFVKYRGVHGPPGTPETIITLKR